MRKNGTYKPCLICGTEVYRPGWRIKQRDRVFCSRSCYEIWWAENGPCHLSGSDHHGWKGGKIEKVCLTCGTKYLVTRNKMAPTRKYCTRACSGKALCGPNSGTWKGGISSDRDRAKMSDEYQLWKLAVHKRDKYRCVLCLKNLKNSKPNAHHIKPFSRYPELRCEVENGVTLCERCHKQTYHNEAIFEPILLSRILRDYTSDGRMPILMPKIESELHSDVKRLAEMTNPQADSL